MERLEIEIVQRRRSRRLIQIQRHTDFHAMPHRYETRYPRIMEMAWRKRQSIVLEELGQIDTLVPVLSRPIRNAESSVSMLSKCKEMSCHREALEMQLGDYSPFAAERFQG